jgi:uncharacterized protein (UPF0276 family)
MSQAALNQTVSQLTSHGSGPIPAQAGVGLRAQHHRDVLDGSPEIAWFEAHTENYFADGGAHVRALSAIRERYPLSLHGVGLSLGSSDPLDLEHLKLVRRALQRFEPAMVSEHLSWSSVEGRFANDLLPLPYTEEALRTVSEHVAQAQDFLGRQILIENVSSYLRFSCSTMSEWEFLAGVAAESGCGILLDLNNIYVAACNHGFDPHAYLQGIDPQRVKELHLAGHSRQSIGGRELLIDTHGSPVCEAVWDLYRTALDLFGARPTLIEWDTDIPAQVLLTEAGKAQAIAAQAAQAAAPAIAAHAAHVAAPAATTEEGRVIAA